MNQANRQQPEDQDEIEELAAELFSSHATEHGLPDHWVALHSLDRLAWCNIARRLLASSVVFMRESDATAAAYEDGLNAQT